ncbi:CaiB/BaiF CoA transferase family protein [Hydrogenophaga intermedia]|uniref:CaiB/BaiF CoA transferase family protein n=1 Tax=Hydrogenophaga intermedia TaxID=65786 RepID=UPI0020444E44|nr:CoA transferase [Hydrogenophaga intermedia]MCM3562699.1 CoA transferase [Hydrogenophaga intermedia]
MKSAEQEPAPGPLAGVRIVDLTSVVMGPFASQILADLGADVIKVEAPEGDTVRYIGPSRSDGMGPMYLALNRNKRSIVLDLRHPDGLAALKRLIAGADVLLFNIRPESMRRLGLGYDEVAAVNPRIIYCGAYGFGENGRYAGKPALDDLIQGAVGLPSLVGRVTGEPRYLPTNLCDRTTGLTAVYSVTSALYARERTGRGQAIEVPMFETMAQFVLSDHMYGQTFDPPLADAGYVRLLAKDRRPCRTRDGFICVLIYIDRHWKNFCEMLGRQEMLNDPRFLRMSDRTRNVDALYAFVAEQIAQRTTAEWMEALALADIPAAPMHTPATLMDDPHLADVGFFRWVEHPSEGRIRSMDVPGTWSGTPPAVRRHAPLLGENTCEVLAEAGYSAMDIERLLGSGAARAQEPSPGTKP